MSSAEQDCTDLVNARIGGVRLTFPGHYISLREMDANDPRRKILIADIVKLLPRGPQQRFTTFFNEAQVLTLGDLEGCRVRLYEQFPRHPDMDQLEEKLYNLLLIILHRTQEPEDAVNAM